MVSLGGWSLAYSVQLGFTTLHGQLPWQRIGLAIGGTIPVLWLLFTLRYSGKDSWLTRSKQALLTIEPLVFAVLTLTNPYHRLIWKEATLAVTTAGPVVNLSFAVGYYLHITYAYLSIGAGIGLLLHVYIQESSAYRKQAGLLILGALLPAAANIAYTLRVSWGPLPALDPTPFAFVHTGVLFGLALFQFDLLDRELIARQHILEETGDGLIILDTDGYIINTNPVAQHILPPTLTRGGSIIELSPDEAETVDAALRVLDKRTITMTVDGQEHAYDVDCSALTDHRGDTVGHVLSLRDVTDRTEYERQNEQLEEFAGIVSHDLRNPLNVANGRLELARRECDSEHLDAVADAHDRMERLIDELLTMAREGNRIGETEAVELANIFENCWQNVKTREATLVIQTNRTVRADPSRVQQLAENLIRNAVEHGGENVTLTVGDLDAGTGFYVADDGPGIPETDREKVFESGYSNAAEGTGLGLGIVNTIVNAHGWEVSVTDSKDGGARFEITGVEFVTG